MYEYSIIIDADHLVSSLQKLWKIHILIFCKQLLQTVELEDLDTLNVWEFVFRINKYIY